MAKISRSPARIGKSVRKFKKPPRKTVSPTRSAERVAKYRAAKRHAGMKLLQIWIPDPSSPKFPAEARRQSLLVHVTPEEMEWLREAADAIEDWTA
jgi:hypothetical protein